MTESLSDGPVGLEGHRAGDKVPGGLDPNLLFPVSLEWERADVPGGSRAGTDVPVRPGVGADVPGGLGERADVP